ncbi:MAG: hypothetical protein PHF14_15605 [Verrucomicrobiota bacterium]|nr:hypothetical protein [Verrucomicrobiota bacterium]MDD8047889.1 hypothetical protein [Verrucomicrobiota bacterium]MDI9384526.1 hypothetical protein [Verrucomicrobiota bacterium]
MPSALVAQPWGVCGGVVGFAGFAGADVVVPPVLVVERLEEVVPELLAGAGGVASLLFWAAADSLY